MKVYFLAHSLPPANENLLYTQLRTYMEGGFLPVLPRRREQTRTSDVQLAKACDGVVAFVLKGGPYHDCVLDELSAARSVGRPCYVIAEADVLLGCPDLLRYDPVPYDPVDLAQFARDLVDRGEGVGVGVPWAAISGLYVAMLASPALRQLAAMG